MPPLASDGSWGGGRGELEAGVLMRLGSLELEGFGGGTGGVWRGEYIFEVVVLQFARKRRRAVRGWNRLRYLMKSFNVELVVIDSFPVGLP